MASVMASFSPSAESERRHTYRRMPWKRGLGIGLGYTHCLRGQRYKSTPHIIEGCQIVGRRVPIHNWARFGMAGARILEAFPDSDWISSGVLFPVSRYS